MDLFFFIIFLYLGDFIFLRIWYNNLGFSLLWYLKEVIICDLKIGCMFVFMCNCWFVVEFDDGEVLWILFFVR